MRDHYDILGYQATVSTNAAEAYAALRCIFSGFPTLPDSQGNASALYQLVAEADLWMVR